MIVEEFDGPTGGRSEKVILSDGSDVVIESNDHLFRGDYSIDGQDLILSFGDAEVLRIAGYFSFAEPADLVSSDGAVIRGADVARMAGAAVDQRTAFLHNNEANDATVVPAQAEISADAIGQVDTLAGEVTVTRADGTRVTLSEGELVYQNDVVQTGDGSTVSLVFVDGTVFTLAQGSRMVLDEMIFDPDGSENSAVFNLIQGGFVFVAGQVAKTGGMDVNTPTSTIGIRGTTVEVRIVVVNGVTEVVVSLLPDWPDGALGRVELFDQAGNFITTLTDPETSWVISPIEGETRAVPRAEVIEADSEQLLAQTYEVTERAELRVENGGNYIDFDGANGDGGGDDGGGQAAPGAGGGDDAQQAPDGGTQPSPQGEQEGSEDTEDAGTGEEAAPEQLNDDDTPPPGEEQQQDSAPDTEDDASLQNQDSEEATQTAAAELPEGEVETTELATAGTEQAEAEQAAAADGATATAEAEGTTAVEAATTETATAEQTQNTESSDVAENTATLQGTATEAGTDTGTESGDVQTAQTTQQTETGSTETAAAGALPATTTGDDPATASDPLPQTTAATETTTGGAELRTFETAQTGETSDPQASSTDTSGTSETETVLAQVEAGLEADLADVSNFDLAPATFETQQFATTDPGLGPGTQDTSTQTLGGDPGLGDTSAIDPFATTQSFVSSAEQTSSVETVQAGVVSAVLAPAPVQAQIAPETGSVTADAVEDQFANIDVMSSVTDDSGTALTLVAVSDPANGTASIAVDGTVNYTPDPDFAGTDSFTYTVENGLGGTATGTVNVSVAPVNDAPVAEDDQATTAQQTAVVIDVLGNDTDIDNANADLAVTVTGQPANGTVQLSGTQLIYTPDPGFFGTDTFDYVVTDGTDQSVQAATVTIDVNDPPQATADTASLSEDGSASINVLGNDSDTEGDAITVDVVSDPSNGTVAIGAGGTITYTPDPDFSGADSFTYTISDAAGGEDTATVSVTVAPVNDAPVATDDQANATEDTAIFVDLLANDVDVDGDALTVDLGTPANGTVVFDGTGFLYTPDPNFSGTDSFTYTIDDGNGGQDTGEVTVTVAAVNDAPVAATDTGTGDEDTDITVNVVQNDTDPDGDALTVSSFSNGANGSVALDGSGNLVYTPDADFSGSDSFTYSVVDGNGESATGTVVVVINAVNDVPVIAEDTVGTDEDTAVTFDVLGNDQDVDGDTLSVSSVTQPSNGSVVIEGTGELTYTPDTGFSGIDTFTYTIVDGNGGTDTGTVTVGVAFINFDPVASDDGYGVTEDGSLDVLAANGVLDNDSDPDQDPLAVNLLVDVSNGSLTLNPDGSFSYTPDANFNGVDGFTYEIDDGQGGTDTASVTIDVDAVNDAPIAADDGGFSTPFNTALNIDVADLLANDSDGDPEINQTLSVQSVGNAVGGTVALAGDTVTFTPTTGFSGAANFSYDVSDGAGGVATATVTLSVGANAAPVAQDDAVTTNEDTAVDTGLLANDTDADGDPLSVTLGTPSNGTVAFDGSGYVYTPDANFSGTDSFTYTVDDGNGGQDTALVTITVTSVNDAPVAGDDNQSTTEDTSLTFDVLGNDADVDGDTLSVVGTTTPTNGSVVIEASGELTYTPDADFAGSDSFTYTISDGNGGTSTGTVAILINAVNDAPIAEADVAATDEDVAVTIDVLANDTDAENDTLTVTGVGTAANGSVVIEANGEVTYTPDTGFSGTDSFTYTISDGNGGVDTGSVTVGVAFINFDPVANDDAYSLQEDGELTVAAGLGILGNDTDPDLDPLSFTLESNVSNGTLQISADGGFTYTPDVDFNGTDSFTYAVSDGQGGQDTANVEITITPVNDDPVAVNDGGYSTPFNTAIDIDVAELLANDSDGDPELVQTLTILSVGDPVGGAVDLAAGTVTFTPTAGFTGAASFSYQVSDGAGGTTTATVSLSVGANAAPNAVDDTAITDEDASVYVNLLANDTDADGDTLSVTLGTPSNGSVAFDGEGYLYTPDADFNGTDSFTYSIDDGNGGQDTATVNITVNAVNDDPVAGADVVSTDEDVAVTFAVLGNDSDVDGDTLTVANVVQPANGSVVIEASGALTYTPDADFSGSDTILYTISDGNGGTAQGSVDVTVNPVNDAPVVADDDFATTENAVVNGDIFADNGNGVDADPEGTSLSLVSAQNSDGGNIRIDGVNIILPSGATLRFFANGTFEYNPGGFTNSTTLFEQLGDGEALTETFTYTVADETGQESTGTVSIEVSGENDAPVTTIDQYNPTEDETVSGNVITDSTAGSADFDPEGDAFEITQIDGVDLATADEDASQAGTQITVSDGGQLTIFADGSFTFDTAGAYESLGDATGQLVARLQSVQYTVTDANGASATESLRFSVQGVNDAPDAVNDTENTDQDTAINISVLANDTDVEGDSFTVTAVTQGTNGTVVIEADNTITYTPDSAFSGSDSFTYTVTDEHGASSIGTVNVGVAFVNLAPEAVADAYTVAEDGTLDTVALALPGVLANDSDPNGDPLTVSLQVDVSNGTLNLNADGSFIYTPNAGFNGADSFTYEVQDGNGGSDTAVVNLDVTPVNDDPVAVDDSMFSTFVDTPINIATAALLVNDDDGDPDVDQTLSVTSVTSGTGGTVSLSGDTITFTPDAGLNDAYADFTYTLSDGAGGTTTATVLVRVGTPTGDIVSDFENGLQGWTVENAVEDLQWVSTGGNPDGHAEAKDVVDGVFWNWVAPAAYLGDKSQYVGGTLSFDLQSISDALDTNGSPDLRLTGGGLTIALNFGRPSDTEFTNFVVSLDDTSNWRLNTEGGAAATQAQIEQVLSDLTSIRIRGEYHQGEAVGKLDNVIMAASDAPRAEDDSATLDEDGSINIAVLANDTDAQNDPLTVESVTLAANGLVQIENDGTITYTPNADFNGSDSFTYTISDGTGETDTATVNLTVTAVNDDPVAVDDSNFSTFADAPVDIAVSDLLINDSDGDAEVDQTLSITSVTSGTGGTASLVGDTITFTPDAGLNDAYADFTYTLSDGEGGTTTGTVLVRVGTPTGDIVSDFENGLQGWNADNDAGNLQWVASGGNPGGYAQAEDLVTGQYWNWVAPAAYLGDKSAYGGGTLSFDLQAIADGNNLNGSPDLRLSGGGLTIAINIGRPSETEFTSFSVTLDDSSNWRINTESGRAATQAEIDQVLADLTSIRIRGEYHNGEGTGLLDSVVMSLPGAPTAADDTATVTEDSSVNIAVLANDTDPQNDALTVQSVTQGTNGTVQIETNGTVTYTPDADFNGTDSFTYTVDDGNGGADTGTVNVTVNAANDAPIAADDTFDLPNVSGVIVNVFDDNGNGADVDPDGDSFTLVAATDQDGRALGGFGLPAFTGLNSGANVRISPNGTFEFYAAGFPTKRDTDFLRLDDGEVLSETFTYTIEDSTGAQSTATVVFNVTGANDAPIGADDLYQIDENETVSGNALTDQTTQFVDFDLEDDPFEITAINGVALADADDDPNTAGIQIDFTSGALLTITADGTFTFETNDGYENLGDAPGQQTSLFQWVNYTITDDNGGSDVARLNFQIFGTNDAPDAVSDTVDTAEDTPVNFDVLTNDSDAEGDSFSVTQVVQPTNGSVVIETDGTLTYTPDAGFSGPDTFTYTVADVHGAESTGSVTVNVAFVNFAPEADVDSYSVNEDAVLTVDAANGVLANDLDPDGDALTATLDTDVSNGTLTLNSDGSFEYTPDADFNGTDSFTYSVDDGNGGSDGSTVTITVDPVADPVVLDPVTGDDFIDATEQLSNIVVSGLADPNGQVTIDFGGTVSTVGVATDGTFSETFASSAIPDASSVNIAITSVDANGNASGSTSQVVGIEQGPATITINVAGSTTSYENPSEVFGLNINGLIDAAHFDLTGLAPSVRTPATSSTEIQFTAPDGRTLIYTGTDLNWAAGTGTITGINLGTPSDADYFASTGQLLPVASLQAALGASVAGGAFDPSPLYAIYASGSYVYNGTDQQDWIDFTDISPNDDIFIGNGGDDEADFGLGDDQYFGGEGNDYFYDVDGNNAFDGEVGNADQVSYGDAAFTVDIDLNAGTVVKGDGTQDTITNVEWVRGGQANDTIQMLDNINFGRTRGFAGDDTITGGTGSFNQVAYDRDSRYTANTTGVTVNLALGFAIDLFGNTDTLVNIQSALGTEFGDQLTGGGGDTELYGGDGDDTVISGDTNDYYELGAGEDILIFTQGFDYVQDFNLDEDTLVFSGAAQADFDSLVITDFEINGVTGAQLTFTNGLGASYGILLEGVDTQAIADYLAFSEYFYGSDADDTIELTAVDGDALIIIASLGNDTYIYSNSEFGAYQELRYNELGLSSITVTLDANATNSTVDKGAAGTDTLVDVGTVASWAFGMYGTEGNDTYNITHSNTGFAWFGIFESGGDDVINLFGGNGWLRVNGGEDGEDVTADLGAGTVSSAGGTITINEVGDTSSITYNLRTHAGNDTVVGSDGRDSIILGSGTDSADALGGWDTIQYNRFDIFQGVTVNLQTGIATGIWDGLAFTHTLSNFEEVRGSEFDDNLTAEGAGGPGVNEGNGTRLDGRGGNDSLFGGSGRDSLNGGDGDDLIDASAGTSESQGYGDSVNPGTGSNTIIGHQGHWESGDGIDLWYGDITGSGGLVVTLGLNGSGTVVSNAVGVVNDTFTYANWLRTTDDDDTLIGADSYGAVNENFNLVAGGGNDTLIGGGGRENLRGGDGDDLLDASGGSPANQFWGDFVQPGLGVDTVIGHQEIWLNGDGIDLSYEDVSGVGGLTFNVANDGSGTVTSGISGQVNDTFTFTDFFHGSQDADVFNGSDQDFEGWTGRAGNDVFNAGGGDDLLNYDDDRFNGGNLGVNVNFQTGTATDGFGDTDTFSGIERVRGTQFDDVFIGSTNDESFELRDGADSLTFNGGYDYVDDFNPDEDALTFSGDPVTYIGTLDVEVYGDGVAFRFDDDFDQSFSNEYEIVLRDVSLEQGYQILGGMGFTGVNVTGTGGDDAGFGTPGNDTIDLGANNFGRDRIYASAGDDTIILSNGTSETGTNIRYDTLGPVDMVLDIDFNQTNGTVDKGFAGTDTLVDVQVAAASDVFWINDGSGNATYNITQHATQWGQMQIHHGLSDDVVNLTGGVGSLRLETGYDERNVTADLSAGFVNVQDGGSFTINYSGDFSESRLEIQTRNGNDSIIGTDFSNQFQLFGGTDFADGRGGYDIVRYDNSRVIQGVTVNLESGTATGRWDGFDFTHTLVNIEEVRGSNFADALFANNSGSSLDGRSGDDVLIGGDGDDELRSRDGVDILAGNGGNDFYNVSSGNNTIIYSSGDDFAFGFDVDFDNVQWAGAALANVGSLTLNEYVFDGDTRVRFEFNNGVDTFGIDFSSMTLAQANQVLTNMASQVNYIIGTDGRDDLFGTSGNDEINLLSNTGQGDIGGDSGGDDIYRFTQASELGWYGITYGNAAINGITANADLNLETNTVVKTGVGTDSLVDLIEAAQGFFFFGGTASNDVYNIVGHNSQEAYLEITGEGGDDIINFTATQGSFRPKMDVSDDVVVDFSALDSGGAGTLTSSGGDTYTLNVTGNLANTSLDSWTGSGDDTFLGNNFSNQVVLGSGTDIADGAGGYDVIRYNRSEITSGVTVDLQAGTASGFYDGLAFSHTLSNFEEVRGSNSDDTMTAADNGESNLRGRDGNDLLMRSDFGEDWTDGDAGRDTLVQTASGSFDFSAINVQDHYQQIEVLSFENGGGDGITLSLQNIMDLSDTADSLLEGIFGSDAENSITVLGDVGDNLDLTDESYTYVQPINDGQGRTLDVYQYESGGSVLAMIAVDQDVAVDGSGSNI